MPTTSFRYWYVQKFGNLHIAVQIVMWFFYGFIWIPILYFAGKSANDFQSNTASKLLSSTPYIGWIPWYKLWKKTSNREIKKKAVAYVLPFVAYIAILILYRGQKPPSDDIFFAVLAFVMASEVIMWPKRVYDTWVKNFDNVSVGNAATDNLEYEINVDLDQSSEQSSSAEQPTVSVDHGKSVETSLKPTIVVEHEVHVPIVDDNKPKSKTPKDKQFSDALPIGSHLQQYKIKQVLGQGGFGITYLAQDKRLEHHVAVKEYLPVELATRDQNRTVRPKSQLHENDFAWGEKRFLDEAKTLARFKHSNIVRINTFFEENGTAYLVMEFEEGESLAALLKRCRTLPQKEITSILIPLLDGLDVLHASGIIHRDIKPANIYMRKNGDPVLLDFGASRHALGAHSKTLTAIVSPGYAPFEQYYADKNKQGAWSDIYALGAVAYRAVTGKSPVEATLRSSARLRGNDDPLTPATILGKDRYTNDFLQCIDKALMLLETDRYQTAKEWYNCVC